MGMEQSSLTIDGKCRKKDESRGESIGLLISELTALTITWVVLFQFGAIHDQEKARVSSFGQIV